MSGIRIDPSNLSAAAKTIPPSTPVLMLNLLRFRPDALYSSGASYPPSSGKDAYINGYLPVFQEIAASVDTNIKPFWFGVPLAHLIGPGDVTEGAKAEKWDVAALVRYPSFQAFRDVTESEKYQKEGLPHRLAGLEDWRLIATVEITREQMLGT